MRTYFFGVPFIVFLSFSSLFAMQSSTQEEPTFFGLPVLNEKMSFAAFAVEGGLDTGDVEHVFRNIMPPENGILKITKDGRSYDLDQKAVKDACYCYQGLGIFAQHCDDKTLQKALSELIQEHWWLEGLYTKNLSSTRTIFKYLGKQPISGH